MDSLFAAKISEYAFQRDQQEFNLGDTLDIKTGLILAALTFLAIQSGELLRPGITTYVAILQTISITALALGGAFVVFELKPRDYYREEPPSVYISWADELKSKGLDESAIPQKIADRRLTLANERVTANLALNIKKSRAMINAFWFTVAAFGLNLLTLALIMRLS
jgi:hypothetical protein